MGSKCLSVHKYDIKLLLFILLSGFIIVSFKISRVFKKFHTDANPYMKEQ